MRLIDADQLIKDGWHLERSGRSNRTLGRMSIADVPTAYDLEEKLQRLKAEYKPIDTTRRNGKTLRMGFNGGIARAIEIVKGGEE